MEDAIKLEKKISDEVSAVRNSCQEIADIIIAAEADKVEARKDYGSFLDRGNELGMSGALRRIREADKKLEGLPDRKEEFFGKFKRLENEYKTLLKIEQQLIKEAKDILDQAQKDFEEAERRNTRVLGIQAVLNELKSLVLECFKAKAEVPGNEDLK